MPYSTYLVERMGSARMAGATRFRAAEIDTIAVEYTAGDFGIDDGGAIKLAWRHCCDMAAPHTEDPRAPAYASAEASNDAVLACSYSPKGSFRPYAKTLMVTVAEGYLAPGDTITVRIGNTRGGSPGIRMQSVVESGHQIRVLADPITLAGAANAVLSVRTPQGEETVTVAELDAGERFFDCGGIDRRMRVFRLSEENPHRAVSLTRRVALRPRGDNPLYVCVTLEDRHQAWSSPIYLIR